MSRQGQGFPGNVIDLFDNLNLPQTARRQIVSSILSVYIYKQQVPWLEKTAGSTLVPYIEQSIDQRLINDSGDLKAADRLYKSGTAGGFQVPLQSEVLKFLVKRFPNGELAGGITRYEAVRGRSYFFGQKEGWYRAEGKDFDNPEQGITKWLAFLKEFPRHPAADDAAYRLARCYQITGQYAEALYWFSQAAQTGDRDMAYDAEGQFLYTLDAAMTSHDFSVLDTKNLPDWTRPLIQYSNGVQLLREHHYAKAVEILKEFSDQYGGHNIFIKMFDDNNDGNLGSASGREMALASDQVYPFWDEVKTQLALAENLANRMADIEQAQGPVKAKEQYGLAAVLYHQPLAFYNHLWQGRRQEFFWLGQIKFMDYGPIMDRYVSRFNNYVQAIEAFRAIDLNQADAKLGAKVLFSQALAYSKLIDYGQEVSFYDTDTHLGEQLINSAKNLLTRYPDSELADDGMILIYNYTGASILLTLKLWIQPS